MCRIRRVFPSIIHHPLLLATTTDLWSHVLCAHAIVRFSIVISSTIISIVTSRWRTAFGNVAVPIVIPHRPAAHRSTSLIEQRRRSRTVIFPITCIRCALNYLRINATGVAVVRKAVPVTIVIWTTALIIGQHNPVVDVLVCGPIPNVRAALGNMY